MGSQTGDAEKPGHRVEKEGSVLEVEEKTDRSEHADGQKEFPQAGPPGPVDQQCTSVIDRCGKQHSQAPYRLAPSVKNQGENGQNRISPGLLSGNEYENV